MHEKECCIFEWESNGPMINTSRANGRSAIQLLGLKVERASRLPLSRAQAQVNVQTGETHCPAISSLESLTR